MNPARYLREQTEEMRAIPFETDGEECLGDIAVAAVMGVVVFLFLLFSF